MNKLKLAQWVKDYALKHGATQVEVNIYNKRSISVTYRDKNIEKLKESTENQLSLYIYVDNRYSGNSTNNLNKSELERFIKEAIASTRYLTPDKFRALPNPKFYPQNTDLNLGLVDSNFDNLTTEKRIEIAKKMAISAKEQSDKIISATGSFSDSYYELVKVLSNGFVGEKSGTNYSVSSSVTVKDGDARPSGWDYATNHFFDKLPSFNNIGIQASKRALRKIGQKKIDSGNYDMLVENRSVGRLLWMLLGPMNARAIQQKKSFLEGQIGKKIASDKLTIIDDPLIKNGMGSRLFDGDGLESKRRVMVKKGVLKQIYVDNYYGSKLGIDPTASGSSNIVLDYGENSLEQMIKSIDKGILVTSFNGGNSNTTTGDFSLGIGGIIIEKGILTIPVFEMNISGNAKEFWDKLAEVGNDINFNSSWRLASLLFKDIHFSGK